MSTADVTKPAAAAGEAALALARNRTERRAGPVRLGTVIVLVLGLLVTTVLVLGAHTLHQSNENRLLRQRVREAGAVLSTAVPSIQTPLTAAATLAQFTHGDETTFRELVRPTVAEGGPFVSVSLWSTDLTRRRPLTTVGKRPELMAQGPDISGYLRRAARGDRMAIKNLLTARDRRLGYGVTFRGGAYIAYAEAELPKDRRTAVDRNSAFADLAYALYFGDRPDASQLLASSTGGGSIGGRRASTTVPFGDAKILLVMSPKRELGGTLLARLPWLLAVGGIALTGGAALLTERLIRRRQHAETLAAENASLYADQRTVAETLQRSLLPERLPEVPGLAMGTRYVAGVEGIDIGGDWYDVMVVDEDRVLFVVGDVSGRGLRAATVMAALRYAIRAYAAQGDGPDQILTKLSGLISVGRDGHFATVLCATVDVAAHRMTLANAGHPLPLLLADGGGDYVGLPTGVPVGVAGAAPYEAVTVTVPPRATLVAYTDGLVERRGETLDAGLQRLKEAAVADGGSLDDLLTSILARVVPDGAQDDTAVLGLRWRD